MPLGSILRNGRRGSFKRAIVYETMASKPLSGLLFGAAVWNVGGFVRLNTSASTNGALVWSRVLPTSFTATADMAVSSITGADAMYFFFGCGIIPVSEAATTNMGYVVERNEFSNVIRIRYAGTILASTSYTDDTSFDTLSIAYNAQTFVITYKGSVVLSYTDPTPRTFPGNFYGFGSRSGGTANQHDIKNVLISL